jgi:hypothetical protein
MFVVYMPSPTFTYFHNSVTIESCTFMVQPQLPCCRDLVWCIVQSSYDVPLVWVRNENPMEAAQGNVVGDTRWWNHSTELLQLFLHCMLASTVILKQTLLHMWATPFKFVLLSVFPVSLPVPPRVKCLNQWVSGLPLCLPHWFRKTCLSFLSQICAAQWQMALMSTNSSS